MAKPKPNCPDKRLWVPAEALKAALHIMNGGTLPPPVIRNAIAQLQIAFKDHEEIERYFDFIEGGPK